MFKIGLLPLLISAAFCVTAPAIASAQDTGGFAIQAIVPQVCGVEADNFVIDDASGVMHGTVQEYCNGGSFQIFSSHRQLTSDESAQIEYDGIVAPIQQSGMTFVALRAGPRFRNVPVVIRSQNLDADLSLSFSITAI